MKLSSMFGFSTRVIGKGNVAVNIRFCFRYAHIES